jgi:hypothetical protein
MRTGNTFVVWLKLGEFLLRSVEPISESGRWKALPDILDGDADGVVLFMRRGSTFATTHTLIFNENTLIFMKDLLLQKAYPSLNRPSKDWPRKSNLNATTGMPVKNARDLLRGGLAKEWLLDRCAQ